MFAIRTFNQSDHDYAGVVAVHNADQADEPITTELLRYDDCKHNPNYLDQRFVIEHTPISGGEPTIIATSRIRESQGRYVPGKYEISFYIIPEFANDTQRAQIYEFMLDFLSRRTPAPKILETRVRESWTEQVGFWRSHGFDLVLREPISLLEVTDYDFSGIADALEQVNSCGIQIFTMTELQQQDSDWLRHYYDLHSAISLDVPSTDRRTQRPFEEWVDRTIDNLSLLPDANFFALNDGHYVGVSNLWKDLANEQFLNVGITGVLRRHRRKGIATALKLKTIRYAAKHGIVLLKTANEENNPMYELNLRLGFKPKPAWLTLRKTI